MIRKGMEVTLEWITCLWMVLIWHTVDTNCVQCTNSKEILETRALTYTKYYLYFKKLSATPCYRAIGYLYQLALLVHFHRRVVRCFDPLLMHYKIWKSNPSQSKSSFAFDYDGFSYISLHYLNFPRFYSIQIMKSYFVKKAPI